MAIDFTNIDKIISLNADDMDIIVQPRVRWITLNKKAEKSGLFFPINPGPTISLILTATISGIVGTSCSSTNIIRYRTIKDWVINLIVILADRTIVKTHLYSKSAAGYNLINLFIGSKGTLGLVIEITLKLIVIPKETSVTIVTFPTIRDAVVVALKVIRAGVPVAISVINRSGFTLKKWKEVLTMFFKFSGTKAGSIDVIVLLLRLPNIIEVFKKEIDDLGLTASILGYVRDGNFHKSILYNGKNIKERAAVEKCINDIVNRALEMEGTYTSKYRIRLGKKESLLKELRLETISIIKSIKEALDPYWLINPKKIMDISK
ncbi:FAD-linked oxidase-like protein [Cenococcum geophilum]